MPWVSDAAERRPERVSMLLWTNRRSETRSIGDAAQLWRRVFQKADDLCASLCIAVSSRSVSAVHLDRNAAVSLWQTDHLPSMLVLGVVLGGSPFMQSALRPASLVR